ncbi:hypothetical protein KMW28_26850 [Flammeovirga yaeyamensis]|uniref:LysM domain-containing protein n=1 Tax=Flammeovirga yaeyamensis TaxID=367791 RepID=A0AAX1NAL8_9BACT|nr:hypothetical protein [Flammeovirga yaeyamensis]MBB3701541.1 hypothetical protein [Flammeovirga yaeyamensis]NMF38685.1 hypothetical protein [Flammeovirga yaeyamensis]QWG04519.1 hypothetical protein KMW28_26850 [Flammeovirga yaeyamensis]
MPEYAQKTKESSGYSNKSYSSGYLFEKRKEIDPKDPPPIYIFVDCNFNRRLDNDISFTFHYDKGYFIDEDILRPCILKLNWNDPFIKYELQLPNSVFEKLKDRLITHFNGLSFIHTSSSVVSIPYNNNEAGGYDAFNKETVFSQTQNSKGHYISNSKYLVKSLDELSVALNIQSQFSMQLDQHYKKYQNSLPKALNYEELVKRMYSEVNTEYRTTKYFQAKTDLWLLSLSPNALGSYIRGDIIQSTFSDLYHFFCGPDEDEFFDVLSKINNHPPSIEKLESTFKRLYPEEKGIKEWLVKELPEHRKIWLQFLPNINKGELPLDYDLIAKNILQNYEDYKNASHYKIDPSKIKTRLDGWEAYHRMPKMPQVRKKVMNGIQTELEKLEMNAASVETLLNNEAFYDKSLMGLLKEMKIADQLAYLLPTVNQISWVDIVYVEDVSYSLDEILHKEKSFKKEENIHIPYANGNLIRYQDTGEYAYMVSEGDTISGILKRFNIKKEDLMLSNWWDGFAENGQYLIGNDHHWLQEGDILSLPHYFFPLNGQTFYIYDRWGEKGIKAQKQQGEYKRIPVHCTDYQELKQLVKDKIDEFDDNTRTYNLTLDISLSITAQLTAFFYIGITTGGNIELGSGDTRSFDVASQCFLNGDIGVGNKALANAGASGGRKQSFDLGHFNSLNGSYSSANHFLAFFERSLYSFMKTYELDDALKKSGLDDFYWENERNKEYGVWDELAKGYTRKVRVANHGQLEAGVAGVGSLKAGMEYKYAESYGMKGVTTMEDLLIDDDYDHILKQAIEEDKTITSYVEATIGDYKLKFNFTDVLFSTNQSNLGNYMSISLTLPGDDMLELLKVIKNDLMTLGMVKDAIPEKKEYFSKSKVVQEARKQKEMQSTRLDKINKQKEAAKESGEMVERLKKQGKSRKEWRPFFTKQQAALREIRTTEIKLKRDTLKKKISDLFKKHLKDDSIKKHLKKPIRSVTKERNHDLIFGKGVETYTRLVANFQQKEDGYKLLYFRAIVGGSAKATIGTRKSFADLTGKVTGEVEVMEFLGTNTISYASTVNNGIFKEGLQRLNQSEKAYFNAFVQNALQELKSKGLEEVFSRISPNNIKRLKEYTNALSSRYERQKNLFPDKTLEDFYQGGWSEEKKQFSSLISNIMNELEEGENYMTPINLNDFSKDQVVLLSCIKTHLMKNVESLRYQPPITSSELFQTYGSNDPRFIAIRDKILREEKASKQWSIYKNTRGVDHFSGEKDEKASEMNAIALNFGNKVKDAVIAYAAVLKKNKILPEQAKWSECPIDDLSPQQADLYLGKIEHIVRFLHRSGSKLEEKSMNTFEEKNISEFMKNLLIKNEEEEIDLLTLFEKDILYPLMLENIVYGKQVYKPY